MQLRMLPLSFRFRLALRILSLVTSTMQSPLELSMFSGKLLFLVTPGIRFSQGLQPILLPGFTVASSSLGREFDTNVYLGNSKVLKVNLLSCLPSMLGYCPDKAVHKKFWGLCEQLLNISDETEDEEKNKEYIEETNNHCVIIAAAKLVASDSVSKDYLAQV